MVIRQRQIHVGAQQSDRQLQPDALGFWHAQNARLRHVQYGRAHQRAIDAAIGHGECAALQIINGQFAVARLAAHFGNRQFNIANPIFCTSRMTGTAALFPCPCKPFIDVVFIDDFIFRHFTLMAGISDNAVTQARAKKPIKPSRAPYFVRTNPYIRAAHPSARPYRPH